MLANEDKASHCMYPAVFGMKELGQCLPSIDELRKSNRWWKIEPLKTLVTAYVIDGSFGPGHGGLLPYHAHLGNFRPDSPATKQQIVP